MITFGATSNVADVANAFQKMAQGQVPFATSIAINRTADFAKDTLKSTMQRVFDRPKPFVVNSIFIRRSNKTRLTATIFHSDRVSPYLRAQIEGGDRGAKRFEIKAGGQILIPTNNIQRDSYGGISKAFIARVLSEAQPLANRTRYVIVKEGERSSLSPGVYERKDGSIRALFIFKSRAIYTKRYDMEGVVKRVVQAEFGRQFSAAMDFALATAKIRVPR